MQSNEIIPVNDQEPSADALTVRSRAAGGEDGGQHVPGRVITVTSDSPPHAVLETPAGEEELWGHGDTRVLDQLE